MSGAPDAARSLFLLYCAGAIVLGAVVLFAGGNPPQRAPQYAAAAQMAIDTSSPENCTAAIAKAVALQQSTDGLSRSIGQGEPEVLSSCFGAVLRTGAMRPFGASAYRCVGRSGTVTLYSESVIAETVSDPRIVAGKCEVKVIDTTNLLRPVGGTAATDLEEGLAPLTPKGAVSNISVPNADVFNDDSPVPYVPEIVREERVYDPLVRDAEISVSENSGIPISHLASVSDQELSVRDERVLDRNTAQAHPSYFPEEVAFSGQQTIFGSKSFDDEAAFRSTRTIPTSVWEPLSDQPDDRVRPYFDLGLDAPESTNIEDRRNELPPAGWENSGPFNLPNNYPDSASTPEEQARIEKESGELSPEAQQQIARESVKFDDIFAGRETLETDDSKEIAVAENPELEGKNEEKTALNTPSCPSGTIHDFASGRCYQKVSLEDLPRGERPPVFAEESELRRMESLGYACEAGIRGQYYCVQTIPPEWLGKNPVQTSPASTPTANESHSVVANNGSTYYSSEYPQGSFALADGLEQDLPTSTWSPPLESEIAFSGEALPPFQEPVAENDLDPFGQNYFGDPVDPDTKSEEPYLPPLRTDAQGVPCDSFGADMSVCNDPNQRCSKLGCFAVRSNPEDIDTLKQADYICSDDEGPQGKFIVCHKPVEDPDMPLPPQRTDASGIPCNAQGADEEVCMRWNESCSKAEGCLAYPSGRANEAFFKRKDYICSRTAENPSVICHKPLTGDPPAPIVTDPYFMTIPSAEWGSLVCKTRPNSGYNRGFNGPAPMNMCKTVVPSAPPEVKF